MMDVSDLSQSSGSNRRRSRKAMSSQVGNISSKLRVRFSSVAEGPLSLAIRVFANKEFVSLDLNDRKRVWYSGLEIRAIKQANIDRVAEKKQAKINNEARGESSDSQQQQEEEENWRGLEHIVEGETKRRQRIHNFVCSILKIQSERQRKGSKPEAIADALGALSKSQSRGDRKRAIKLGKLDYVDARIQQQQPDQGEFTWSRTCPSRNGGAKSILGRSLSSRRRRSDCVPATSSQAPAVRRSLSGDHEYLQKRMHLLRRVSAAMMPHKRHTTTSSSLIINPSASWSVQSTASTASATSSNNVVEPLGCPN
jgi:hypothetical protein